MTAHSEWEALAAGHAFNALEPEDEQAFLAHLAGCDACKRDLASYEGVGAGLAYGVDPAEPPPDLARRILDAAKAERPAFFPPTPQRVALFEKPARPRRSSFRLAPLGAAAAFVLVLALSVWNVVLRADSATTQAALDRRTAALRCLTATDSAQARLASEGDERGTACVGGGKAYVFVDRLAPNDTSSSVYVLWWQDANDGLHAVAPFDVPESGTGLFELPIAVPPSDVRGVAVSLEQGRAMPAAPTRRIAYGAVGA